jgi:hypothetical protein
MASAVDSRMVADSSHCTSAPAGEGIEGGRDAVYYLGAYPARPADDDCSSCRRGGRSPNRLGASRRFGWIARRDALSGARSVPGWC